MKRIVCLVICLLVGCSSSGSSPVEFTKPDATLEPEVDAALDPEGDATLEPEADAEIRETPAFRFSGMTEADGLALLHGLMRLSACGGVSDLNQAISAQFFSVDLDGARVPLEVLTNTPSPVDPTRLEPLTTEVTISRLRERLTCVNAAEGCVEIMACLGVSLETRCHLYEDVGCQGDSIVYCLDTTPRENLITQDEGHVRFERRCFEEGTPNSTCARDTHSDLPRCVAEVGVADCAARIDCEGQYTPECFSGVLRYRDCAAIDQICEAGACALGPNSACQGFPPESYGNHVITCDGDRLVECAHPGLWDKPRFIDCAGFGMRCISERDELLNADFFYCRSGNESCDERADGRECNGTRVEMCVQGEFVHVDCADIGGSCGKNKAHIAACVLNVTE